MTVYVDSDDLKASLTLDGTTYADDDIDQAVAAASGEIEKILHRNFGQTDSDVVRYFTALDRSLLRVDDFVALTSLETDDDGDGVYETTWAGSDYRLAPWNAATDEEPYDTIRVTRFGTHVFPINIPMAVKVTATWGWPTVPMQVVVVAGIIASQLVKRKRDAPFGFVIGPEAAAYISNSDPTIKRQLHGLGRPKLKAE